MREIEFRAWNTQEKRYYYGVEHAYDYTVECSNTGDFIPATSFGEIAECDGSEWIPEQYTGLKDRNGVKIYEGDILEMTNVGWKYTLVKFHLGIFAFYTEETSFLYPMVRCYWEEGRVIGNIHENKDLITEKKNNENTNI